jgi:ribonuclease D
VQVSRWEQRPLTKWQQEYAALDALVCVDIHEWAVKQEGVEKSEVEGVRTSVMHQSCILQTNC